MKLNAKLKPADFEGPFAEHRRFAEQRMEAAALIAVERGTATAVRNIRQAMQGAGLGRLGNGLGTKVDKAVHRRPNGFSASGVVFIRSGSKRTRGAIESYTEGATIRPARGRWLWMPTDDIQRLAGGRSNRERVTPGNWSAHGLDRKIGPLVFLRNPGGNPVLVVRNVGVSLSGKSRSARSLTKRGAPRKGQVAQEIVVAFVGLPRTSRAARIDVPAIVRSVSDQLPAMFNQALGRI